MAKKQYGLGHTRLTVPGRPDLTNKTAVVMVGDKTLEEALEGAGTSDYPDLDNKPQINGVELSGNKTSSDLGVATSQQGAKADTAYQKPSSGIPESDLSSDVQQALQKHFKGWWPDLATLKAAHTATEGDSAYVKDASPATTWSIYVYDSTASSDNYWADSGTDADTSNVQTFASSQEVNEVHIVNDLTTGGSEDVLSAEQGKVLFNRFKTVDDIHSDFSILDENDYRIVEFSNGHIRTKYFNSENITINEKLLKGKTYSILGDSISTYQGFLPSDDSGYDGATYAYFYPKTGLNNVNQTWWKKMEAITGLSLLKNCSWSGSECCGDSTSTTSAEAGCSTRRISDLSKNGVNPDIIIIYIGINDMNTYTLGSWTANEEIPAEGTVLQYAKAYALCVSKVMRTYPSSEIYCCSLLECPTVDIQTGTKTFPCINSHGETLKQYNDAIQEICVGLGANFIDLHACGINYWNCYPTYFLDTTHPNQVGTTLMANYISSRILSITKLKY